MSITLTGRFIMIFLVLLLPQLVQARGGHHGNSHRLELGGIYQINNFERNQGGDAVFSGVGSKLSYEFKSSSSGYGLGLKISYESAKLSNTSNNSSTSESLGQTAYSLSPRVYALDLYVGLGVVSNSIKYDRSHNTLPLSKDFTGSGLRFELGYNWFVSKNFYINPGLTYELSQVKANDSAPASRFSTFGFGVGAGFEF